MLDCSLSDNRTSSTLVVEGAARDPLVGLGFLSNELFEPVAFFRIVGLRELDPQLSNVVQALTDGAAAGRWIGHGNFLNGWGHCRL